MASLRPARFVTPPREREPGANPPAQVLATQAVGSRWRGHSGVRISFFAPTLAGPNLETKRLREALPDFLAEAADRTGGFFQHRLGKCFAERVGRRFGESQVFLERAEEDRKAKVRRWKVVKP